MCGGCVGVGARRRIALPDPETCIRGHGGFGRREGVPERSAEIGGRGTACCKPERG